MLLGWDIRSWWFQKSAARKSEFNLMEGIIDIMITLVLLWLFIVCCWKNFLFHENFCWPWRWLQQFWDRESIDFHGKNNDDDTIMIISEQFRFPSIVYDGENYIQNLCQRLMMFVTFSQEHLRFPSQFSLHHSTLTISMARQYDNKFEATRKATKPIPFHCADNFYGLHTLRRVTRAH